MAESHYLLVFAFILCTSLSSKAQDEEYEYEGRMTGSDQAAEALGDVLEQLEYYRRHPINLNRTNPEELRQLGFLSPLQISNFFLHLNVNGHIVDLLELQAIAGFDLGTVAKILPYVRLSAATVPPIFKLRKLQKNTDQSIVLRYGSILQQQKGFGSSTGSRYQGSADKLLLKYRLQYDDRLSIGFVAEKDAGERWLGSNKLPDFLSGHLFIGKIGIFNKVVIGDYSLQFGQGLTLWSGFAFGKGADVTSVASNDVGIKPYTSSNESTFLRGAAATADINKHISLTAFFSIRKLDASLTPHSNGKTTLININESGLHRNMTELRNKGSLQQQVNGGIAHYHNGNINAGIIAYHSKYNHPFISGTSLYKKYSFQGDRLANAGMYYTWTYRNFYTYGEAASSFDDGYAFLHGVLFGLSRKLSAVILYRNYGKKYHSFFAQSVGENTDSNNEQGYYAGLNYFPSKQWRYSFYVDYFRFPWLKYRVGAPSQGYEILTDFSYIPKKDLKFSMRLKTEHKQQNTDDPKSYSLLQTVVKTNASISCQWMPIRNIRSQQRIDLLFYQKREIRETGLLLLQDLSFKPSVFPISGNIRFAYFRTPSYNSRLYAYERDVMYSASAGNYFGTGFRHYLNLRYSISRRTDLFARYATAIYRNQKTIGSGLDEIQGNIKTDVKFQLRVQI
ncbi:hypothetical protein PBAL39_18199 [Pedobacter sp. BAL39]|uniref:hypothetical protein n=1 Tax=Pedobacter sp. BAL39 TaxID=391596 RepID=UPI000155A109|nr:hypothetical protein [Pedobacter sp. BAL39]EDM36832.1 hypothetical protein PBAL39_18199 [Pedobacter sp. BAL39]